LEGEQKGERFHRQRLELIIGTEYNKRDFASPLWVCLPPKNTQFYGNSKKKKKKKKKELQHPVFQWLLGRLLTTNCTSEAKGVNLNIHFTRGYWIPRTKTTPTKNPLLKRRALGDRPIQASHPYRHSGRRNRIFEKFKWLDIAIYCNRRNVDVFTGFDDHSCKVSLSKLQSN